MRSDAGRRMSDNGSAYISHTSHSSSISPILPPPANSTVVSPQFADRHEYSYAQDVLACATDRRDIRHNGYSDSRAPQAYNPPLSFSAPLHSGGAYDLSLRRGRGPYSPRHRGITTNASRHRTVDHNYTRHPHFLDTPRDQIPPMYESGQESNEASRPERRNGNEYTGHQFRPPPTQNDESQFSYSHSTHSHLGGYQGYDGYRG
jgi:hypothetical protein